MMTDKEMIASLSSRIAAASAILSRLAEKNGAVKEVLRLRSELEKIVLFGGIAGAIARNALEFDLTSRKT